ncbi:MAG: hypothetical protein AAF517_18320, partial [Planctomycetota bacterium]
KVRYDAIEARLKNAIKTDNPEAARASIDQLMAPKELRGVKAVLKYALGGESAQVFGYAAGYLARLEDPQSRAEVFKTLAASRNPKTKIILLAVVRRWPQDAKAMAALHDRLKDRRKEVVFTALRWIREVKNTKSSVPALIDELERRERQARGRVYFDIRKTLRALTGQDLQIAADWRNYWAIQNGAKRKPKRKKAGRTALYKPPSFFSVTVDSDRVLFIIDISQSMLVKDPVVEEEGDDVEVIGDGTTVVRLKRKKKPGEKKPTERTRISAVQEELIRTIQGLAPGIRFNCYSFNHGLQIFDAGAPGGLLDASSSNKARAVAWVRSLRPNGATRTDIALTQALQIRDVDTIYLLTDGAPKTAQNQKIPHQTVFARVNAANRFRKCRINTIGFYQAGSSMRDFVTALAKKNDGQCILLK